MRARARERVRARAPRVPRATRVARVARAARARAARARAARVRAAKAWAARAARAGRARARAARARGAGGVWTWHEGTTKDRAADSDWEGGKGWRGEEMRGWGRDGGRRQTSLQCPLSLPLQPHTVGKQCLHMRVGGAPHRLCHRDHVKGNRSNFLAATE